MAAWAGQIAAWPLRLGRRLLWGDRGGQQGGGPLPPPAQTASGAPERPGDEPGRAGIGLWQKSSSASLSTTTDDVTVCSILGDDVPGLLGHGQEHQHYSVLAVPIPIEEERFQAYLASLPEAVFPRYRLNVPRKPKILVLDLDETLVHSTSASAAEYDFMVEVLVERSSCLYYVHKRPHVDHFLEVVSAWYQLAIYTASLREYADPVVNLLDRGRRLFIKRLFRSACLEQDGAYLKDLSLVDADLSRVLLLDNSTVSFALNPDSAILVEGWVGDRADSGLLDLLPFLDALRFVEDVRSILSLRVYG